MKIAFRKAKKLMERTGEAHLVVGVPGGGSGYEVIGIGDLDISDDHTLPYQISVPQHLKLSISPGNVKLIWIPSVSLPPPMTCADKGRPCYGCKRGEKCYAMGTMYARLPNIKKAWDRNWLIWKTDPKLYFVQISCFLTATKPPLFRYHVGGGVPNQTYMDWVIRVCRVHSDTRFLIFEKGYDIGLDFSEKTDNLAIVLSTWPGMELPDERYGKFPWAWLADDERLEDYDDPIPCSGNCATCQQCWALGGEDVVFHRH